MHRYYLPSRMTIAGVNVNHEEIVELCKKYFVDRSPIWSESNQKIPEVDRSIPQYTGGIITVSTINLFHTIPTLNFSKCRQNNKYVLWYS